MKLSKYLSWIILSYVIYLALSRCAAAWGFNTDDAYITLRYARNLAGGHGISWNVGQPHVEGYSNFLFVLIAGAAIKIGLDPLIVLKLFSVLCLLGTCLCLYRLALEWVGPVAATVPALLLVSYHGTIAWTVSGLETSAYMFFCVTSVAALIKGLRAYQAGGGRPEDGGGINMSLVSASALLALLAALTRPEGPLVFVFGAAVLVYAWMSFRSKGGAVNGHARKAVMLYLLLFSVPYGVYLGWKFYYFGRVVPNSALFKMQFQGDPMALMKGFWNLSKYPALIGLLYPLRKWDARNWLLWSIPVSYAALSYGIDPIIGYWNRHFITAYAFVLVCATVGFFGMLKETGRLQSAVVEAALVLALAAAAGFATQGMDDRLAGFAKDYSGRQELREELAGYLGGLLKPDDWCVMGDCGLVPYMTDFRVIDAYGLNSSELTSSPINGRVEMYIDWILAKRPRAIVVNSGKKESLVPHEFYGFYPRLVAKRGFLDNYRLAAVIGRGGEFNYFVFLSEGPVLN